MRNVESVPVRYLFTQPFAENNLFSFRILINGSARSLPSSLLRLSSFILAAKFMPYADLRTSWFLNQLTMPPHPNLSLLYAEKQNRERKSSSTTPKSFRPQMVPSQVTFPLNAASISLKSRVRDAIPARPPLTSVLFWKKKMLLPASASRNRSDSILFFFV